MAVHALSLPFTSGGKIAIVPCEFVSAYTFIFVSWNLSVGRRSSLSKCPIGIHCLCHEVDRMQTFKTFHWSVVSLHLENTN